ncbi:hypothetical protein [Microbulbifer sp. ALW1]|uniref:hypothetical protein n=1 Tax=Microbulbifer sp. (strain ALW1) TaxID=1516059 RepID=UPI00135CD95B|nr:hypothetical protein [Microbulbifer sp. ALW1]
MLDFIKYTRFEFRKRKGFCVPKAPNVLTAREYSYRLQGNKLLFRAPTQYHFFRPESEQLTSSWTDNDLENLSIHDLKTYNDTWISRTIFLRKYALYGPWFTGEQASAIFSLTAVAPAIENPSINFLNPRAFETAISGLLTAEYGQTLSDDFSADYVAPMDWQPIKSLPVPAVRFLVQSEPWMQRVTYLCFPVSKNRILTFSFSHQQYAPGDFSKRDAAISPKPAQELIDNIINSVQLTPSPELEQELAEIRKTCPDLSVSENFPPLKWPATVDKTGLKIIEMGSEEKKRALAG